MTTKLIDILFKEALNTPEGRKVYTEKTMTELLSKEGMRRNGAKIRNRP